MELLKKKHLFILCALAPFFLMGNKACEKVAPLEHPVLDKGMECSTCHDDGRTPKTKPVGHNTAWEKEHGSWIQRNGLAPDSTCLLCHRESQCSACHQQNPPKDHTLFWKNKAHGVSVGLDRGRCLACHKQVDFCERCHQSNQPLDHAASWGLPLNQHCLNCHFPVTSAGASRCFVCHKTTPSHVAAPAQPSTAPHVAGANCRGCHINLRHPDNGMTCTTCHTR